MNVNPDEHEESTGEPLSSQLNPYAAPILDDAPTVEADLNQGVVVDHAEIAKRAQLFIAMGLTLAIGLFAAVFFAGVMMAALVAFFQLAWVYPALRLSSRHARDLPAGLRIGLRLILVLHVLILGLETMALLFLVTCIAIFSTAGN